MKVSSWGLVPFLRENWKPLWYSNDIRYTTSPADAYAPPPSRHSRFQTDLRSRKKPLCPPPFIPFVPSLVQNQYSAVLTHNRFKYAIVLPIILLLFNHLMAFLYEWIQILVNEFLLYYFPKWLSFLFLDENVTEFVAGNITSMRPHAPLGAKRTNNDEYQINTENTPIGTGKSIRSFVIRLLE